MKNTTILSLAFALACVACGETGSTQQPTAVAEDDYKDQIVELDSAASSTESLIEEIEQSTAELDQAIEEL